MKILISQTATALYKEFFGVSFPTEEVVDELSDFFLEEKNKEVRGQIKYNPEIGCILYIQRNTDGDCIVIGAEKIA